MKNPENQKFQKLEKKYVTSFGLWIDRQTEIETSFRIKEFLYSTFDQGAVQHA